MYSKLFRNVRHVYNLNCSYLKIQSISYSSTVKEKAVDPFGLNEEIEKDEPGITDMVQGIYTTPPRPRMRPDNFPRYPTASTHEPGSVTSASDGQYNLGSEKSDSGRETETGGSDRKDDVDAYESFREKHGHWLKTKTDRVIEKDVTAEKIYSPHFGEMRLDSQNVATIDGQFDEIFFNPDEAQYISSYKYDRLSKKSKDPENPANKREQMKNTYPTEEASNIVNASGNTNTRTRMQNSKVNHSEDPIENNRASPLPSSKPPSIDSGPGKISGSPAATTDITPLKGETRESDVSAHPKTALQYLKLKKLTEAQQKYNSKVTVNVGGQETEIDRNSVRVEARQHIPTIYSRPEFNDIPHDDVWNHLKKNICFHNNFLIALNKPYGFPMHTASVECRHTIIDFLPEFAAFAKVPQIFPCHRLDKDTTGVLLLAKSETAALAIKRKFANRTIKKLYFAITKNCPEIPEGSIEIPIGEGKLPKSDSFRAVLKPDLQKYNITTMQKDCKEAVTKFKVMKSQPYGAFLEVYPKTGLTHQIRVHLAQGLGCPIVGDHKYSHRDKMAPQRLHTEVLDRLNVKQSKVRHLPLHLHCSKLEFTMPDGFMNKEWREPIFIHARPPRFFLHTLKALGLKH